MRNLCITDGNATARKNVIPRGCQDPLTLLDLGEPLRYQGPIISVPLRSHLGFEDYVHKFSLHRQRWLF